MCGTHFSLIHKRNCGTHVSLLSPLPPRRSPSLSRDGRRGPERRRAETAASGGGEGVAWRPASSGDTGVAAAGTGVATAVAPGLSSTASSPTVTRRWSRKTAGGGKTNKQQQIARSGGGGGRGGTWSRSMSNDGYTGGPCCF
uniref:Uncharacterized protein n=1 Tax=Oryza meridionalis TaxID=40149 RepID=A0A0E0EQU0_9ORYZ